VFKTDDVISNVVVVKLIPKIKLELFADIGYDLSKNNLDMERLVRCEGGLLKRFSSEYVNGFLGLSYQYEEQSLNALLMFNL
jgi:hypothetical protein